MHCYTSVANPVLVVQWRDVVFVLTVAIRRRPDATFLPTSSTSAPTSLLSSSSRTAATGWCRLDRRMTWSWTSKTVPEAVCAAMDTSSWLGSECRERSTVSSSPVHSVWRIPVQHQRHAADQTSTRFLIHVTHDLNHNLDKAFGSDFMFINVWMEGTIGLRDTQRSVWPSCNCIYQTTPHRVHACLPKIWERQRWVTPTEI